MPLPFPFDFKKPDYNQVFAWRFERLKRLKENKDPVFLANLKNFYKYNPAQYIIDWGCTYDPRNPERGLPALIPFFLFPIQEETIHFIFDNWRKQQSAVIDKSRDMGISELTVGFAVSMCTFWEGFSVGFGSQRADSVDNKGNPRALLYKARRFIQNTPSIFRGDWDERKNSAFMRITFPNTNSIITGDTGDQIGRGDRKSIFFPDEFAFVERQELADAALAATTNCVIYVSTPNGPNTLFCEKATGGHLPVKIMNWRDDPRRDEVWAEKKKRELNNAVRWASEYENDHYGSLEGVIIHAEWVTAAIDAHIKLGLTPSGVRKSAFDIADEGADKVAQAGRYGFLLEHLDEWTGKNSDPYNSLNKALIVCREKNYPVLKYDCIGIGASIRGDAQRIQEKIIEDNQDKRPEHRQKIIELVPFLSNGSVVNPDDNPFSDDGKFYDGNPFPTNKDLYSNIKAQGWALLARRFQITFRAVTEGYEFKEEDIISLPSDLPLLSKLRGELSQATFKKDEIGKLKVDKKPKGKASPNLADSVMMLYAPEEEIGGFYSGFRIPKRF
jgi:hypothetical protein